MISAPEAFVLLRLPDATLTGKGINTETGILNLESITMPNPESPSDEDRNVYLILKVNVSEYPVDPARVVRCKHLPGTRIYTLEGTSSDPGDLTLSVKVPVSDAELTDKLEAFENILEQYVVEFHGPADNSTTVAQTATAQTEKMGPVHGDKDLRGHLVMINEDTGEVIGEVEDRFRIKEDPVMFEKGHENDPVVIEVAEQTGRESDANALQAFASIVPPDQRNWISKSASIVSHAISMTTNLLITTITTGSSYYIAHSAASPHHPANASTSRASSPSSPTPPPLPPRALVFLTSEKTRKGLSTVHTLTGEAVKVSTKTVSLVDNMIRRAMGAKPKRTKYFAAEVPPSDPNRALLNPGPPPLPPRTRSPSPSSKSSFNLSPYASSSSLNAAPSNAEKPALPPRRGAPPAPPPLPARTGSTQEQRPLKTKDHLLISADLILSTLDDATRRVLDVGTEEIGRVMGHKYGPEAAESSLLMTGSARNVGLVYVDMRGIGRRALLKRAGRTFVKARLSSNQTSVNLEPHVVSSPKV